MALTLPAVDELSVFSHGNTDVFDEEQQDQAIQQAADLLFLATRVTIDPTDPTIARIVKWGILDMAWSLLIKTENKTEIYSPYSSETIGSYSYSKAASQVRMGETTSVEWFDAAVKLLNSEGDSAAVWSSTEHVFEQPFQDDARVITLQDYFGR